MVTEPQASVERAATLETAAAKIKKLIGQLNECLLERKNHVRIALLSVIAGHRALFLGPPGTAKSLLARSVCMCIEGAGYFEYLLSKFTHPDELFGPVSIPGLKEEDYRRLVEGNRWSMAAAVRTRRSS